MKRIALLLTMCSFTSHAQFTPYGLGLVQRPNALTARIYLGTTNFYAGSNIVFRPFGIDAYYIDSIASGGLTNSAGVTNFSSGSFSPVFTTSVATPDSSPSLSFSPISQSSNLFFASPSNAAGNPSFRYIVTNDLPAYVLKKLDDAPSDGNVYGRSNSVWAVVPSGASPSFFYNGQNTAWSVVGGSNQVNVVGLLTNNVSDVIFTNRGVFYITDPTGTQSVFNAYMADGGVGGPIGYLNGPSGQQIQFGANGVLSIFDGGNERIDWNPGGTYISISDFLSIINLYDDGLGTITVDSNLFVSMSVNAPLFNGGAEGLTNGTPSLCTNAATASDGYVFSKTGDRIKLIPMTGGASSGVSIVSSNNVTVSSTVTNLHFWSGTNETLFVTNRNGGNVDVVYGSIGGGGGGGSAFSGIDYPEQDVTAFSNGTNFYVDFSIPAQRWIGTNFALRYSTNWPDNATSRFVNIFIPPTNFTRSIWVYDDATNWQTAGLNARTFIPANSGVIVRSHIWTQGETNVFTTVVSGKSVASAGESFFNPLGIPGLTLWLDASRGLWQDLAGTIPATTNGNAVMRWNDQSGNGFDMTNRATASQVTWVQFGGPNSTPTVNNSTTANIAIFNSVLTNLISPPVWTFVVFNRTATNATHDIFDGGNKPSAASKMLMRIDSTGNWLLAGNSATLTDGKILTFNYQLFEAELNGASSLIKTNGVLAVTGNAGMVGPNGFSVFGSASASAVLQGNISEVLVYNASLTSQNISDIETYLNTKYSIY